MAVPTSAGVHDSMIFSATSLLDCSMCMLGVGPSRRLSPSVFHGSVVSMSKASAPKSERIEEVSVAVDSVCHVGICFLLMGRVVCAAMMSSPFLLSSSSMYSSYLR